MRIESLTELEMRMKKEGIEYFKPAGNGANVTMVEVPKRVIDVDRKEVLYYALIKRVNFDKNGAAKCSEQVYYTILDVDTVRDMLKQVCESFRADDISNMYV